MNLGHGSRYFFTNTVFLSHWGNALEIGVVQEEVRVFGSTNDRSTQVLQINDSSLSEQQKLKEKATQHYAYLKVLFKNIKDPLPGSEVAKLLIDFQEGYRLKIIELLVKIIKPTLNGKEASEILPGTKEKLIISLLVSIFLIGCK